MSVSTAMVGTGRGIDKKYRRYFRGDAMDEYLSRLGLIRKPVAQDESSLFRAVSEQIYDTQRWHGVIRDHVERHVKLYPEQFSNLLQTDVALHAVSSLYKRDMIIYRDLGQSPIQATGSRFTDKIFLCESYGGHFDCVYQKSQYDKLAICQAVSYELLYACMGTTRRQLASSVQVVRARKHQNQMQATSQRTASTDSSNHTDDDRDNQQMDLAAATIEFYDRPPFPFRTCKALDPSIYRNTEYDVWLEARKEELAQNRMRACMERFALGSTCLVRFEPGGAAYHAIVQEHRSPTRVRVFVTQTGVMRDVHVRGIQTLSTANTPQTVTASNEHKTTLTNHTPSTQADTATATATGADTTEEGTGKARRSLFVDSADWCKHVSSVSAAVPINHVSVSAVGGGGSSSAVLVPSDSAVPVCQSASDKDKCYSWQDSGVSCAPSASLQTMLSLYEHSTHAQTHTARAHTPPRTLHQPNNSPVLYTPLGYATQSMSPYCVTPGFASRMLPSNLLQSPVQCSPVQPMFVSRQTPVPSRACSGSGSGQQVQSSESQYLQPAATDQSHVGNNSWLEGELPMLFGYSSSSPDQHSSGYYAEYTSSGDGDGSGKHVHSASTGPVNTTHMHQVFDDKREDEGDSKEPQFQAVLPQGHQQYNMGQLPPPSLAARPLHKKKTPAQAHDSPDHVLSKQLPNRPTNLQVRIVRGAATPTQSRVSASNQYSPPKHNLPSSYPTVLVRGQQPQRMSPMTRPPPLFVPLQQPPPPSRYPAPANYGVPVPNMYPPPQPAPAVFPAAPQQQQHVRLALGLHTGSSVTVPFFDQAALVQVNYQATPSCDPSGADLPGDSPTMRYFYNLGCEYFRQLMYMHMSGTGTR